MVTGEVGTWLQPDVTRLAIQEEDVVSTVPVHLAGDEEAWARERHPTSVGTHGDATAAPRGGRDAGRGAGQELDLGLGDRRGEHNSRSEHTKD